MRNVIAQAWLVLVLILPAGIGLANHGAAAEAAAARSVSMSARYSLDVTVDDVHHRLDAHEIVEATNRTDTPLSSLVFNVTPRHFSGFEILALTVDGTAQQPKFDDVVMEVPLPIPLGPEQTTRIDLRFRETVPSPGNIRYGYSDGILALGNWFPILAVYRDDGWDRHHYSDVGDPFFTEAADYQVTLHGDPHLVIAHSGVLTKYSNGQWEFTGSGIRDFALALSRRYESHTVEVDGTRITSYYLPEDKNGGQSALEYAREAFDWYVAHLGPYGYPSFQVAETPSHVATDVGQEYPNLIFIATTQEHQPPPPGNYLTYLVAHETAHQWFYGLVGSDQVREPWLDEGPAVHLSYLFLRDRYPAAYAREWAQVQADYQKAVASWGKKALDTEVSDYRGDDQYFGLLYRGSALFLDRLREAMGTDSYLTFLRDYVATYRGQTATTRDFLLLAERYAGRDLSDLYREYFRPTSYASPTAVATATLPISRTPAPTATQRPAPTATPSTLVATPTPPTPIAASPTALPPAPAVIATPTASARDEAGSQGLGSALGLIVASSLAGLLLVGLLSFLLMRRS